MNCLSNVRNMIWYRQILVWHWRLEVNPGYQISFFSQAKGSVQKINTFRWWWYLKSNNWYIIMKKCSKLRNASLELHYLSSLQKCDQKTKAMVMYFLIIGQTTFLFKSFPLTNLQKFTVIGVPMAFALTWKITVIKNIYCNG